MLPRIATPVILAVLALLAQLVQTQPVYADQAARPNIVLIVADDLGYRELGCYGQKKIRTPHLDQLAREGMRFTQHYSGNAVCAPSRCVLMTGKHPGHAFIRNNREIQPEGQAPIPADTVTLAKLLKQAGYRTGAFGKWGLGGPGTAGVPTAQGFERFFGYNCQRHAHSYYPSYLWSNDERVALNNHPPVPGHAGLAPGADPADPASYDRFKGQDYAPDRIHAQVLDFIRTHRNEPFFVYYPTVIPHVALHVPDEELKPYLAEKWVDPPFTRQRGGYTPHYTPRAAYAAMITRMDRYVGNVLKLLDEMQLSDNTLVIFSSDNGTTHLKDEVDYDFFASVGELNGLKGQLLEGGIRVPALVRWPGQTRPGSVTRRISGWEDWLPTILDAIGAADQIPQDVDGISLVPTLQGKTEAARPFLYREFSGYGGQQSVRVGKWKAIRQDMARGNLEIQLFNLETDVSETRNVAEDYPEVVAQLKQIMDSQHTPSQLFPLQGVD